MSSVRWPIFVVFAIHAASTLNAASFTFLGDLPGGPFSSVAHSISGDGQVVIGRGNISDNDFVGVGYRWTRTGGFQELPGATPFAASFDGSVIAGTIGFNSGAPQAARWTAANAWQGIGYLAGGQDRSGAYDISADGSAIVGDSSSANGNQGFRWTEPTGMHALGQLPNQTVNYSTATRISADGSVIIGGSITKDGPGGTGVGQILEAWRWTEAQGLLNLGELPGGGMWTNAGAVSSNGSIVVGVSYSSGFRNGEVYRWSAQTGMVGLGWGWPAFPVDMSSDGSIIVGTGPGGIVWDAGHGVRSFTQLMTDAGVSLPAGWQFDELSAISDNGRSVVGTARNTQIFGNEFQAFIAELPEIIPEPTTFVLLASGLVLLVFCSHLKRHRASRRF